MLWRSSLPLARWPALSSPSRVASLGRELFARNPLLTAVAGVHLALFALEAAIMPFDARTVGGLNVWIKPLKFDLSVAVYTLTLAWILAYLPAATARWASRRVALTMAIETFCIGLQAARGVGSHFNKATAFDSAVFTTMGVAIAYNTYVLVRVTWAFFRAPPGSVPLPDLERRGLQWGLTLLLVGSIIGGYMSGRLGHTVGAADGGPGLPLLGWSTRGGDLRVAHFLGLHALQVLWLFSVWIQRRNGNRATHRQLINAAGLAYLTLTLALFASALFGHPVLRGLGA